MLYIVVKNGLGIMPGDIGNSFFTNPYAENICSFCGAEFGPRCGAAMVLNQVFYGLKTASNSLHNYFGNFLGDLGFTPHREDKDLWIHKSENDEGYYYIVTHLDDVTTANNNTSKYMH